MDKPLRVLRRQLTLLTVLGWGIAPLASYSVALFFGMVQLESFAHPNTLILIAAYFVLLTWVATHFQGFLRPLHTWLQSHANGDNLPDNLIQHMQGFTGNY